MEYLGYERFYLACDGQKYLASLQGPKARGTSGTSGEAAEKPPVQSGFIHRSR